MTTTTTTTDGDPAAQALAASIAGAVADRALERLGTHLTDDVRLRALLPGGLVEEHGREDVLARFDHWFGDRDTVVLVDAGGDVAGDRLLVRYTLAVDPDGDRHAVHQSLVCTLWDGLVGRVDLVCSGFRRTP